MSNANERMEKLSFMGVDVGKYFRVNLPDGPTVTLTINENGECAIVNENEIAVENDPILNQIIEDGYVRNTKLHRRFVMAQMFAALNYVSWDRTESGYNACLRNRYGYDYTIKMMIEEARVLSKLEARDRETFEERAHFFNRHVIATVLEDYIAELKKYVDKLPVKKCKGVPYKRIHSVNIFVDDFNKKLYAPVKQYANQILSARDYRKVYEVLCNFKRTMVKLPYNTPKSKTWLDAYKGEGAFYTMKNLIMYHNCNIIDAGTRLSQRESMALINRRLTDYQDEGWRMFALMKKVIEDNHIDTVNHIRNVCNNINDI